MELQEQPPQVIKTNTKFSSSVRFSLPDLANSTINVEASILNELQVRVLMQSCDNSFFSLNSGVLSNRKLELQPTTNQPVANFRNLTVQKINRSEKRGYESVTDEKFVLLFQAKVTLRSGFVYNVKALSLPLVVVVHCNQETAAWATVVWDNAFSSPNRVPFAVPNEAPWARIVQILCTKFGEFVGRELPEDNLHFLAGKAFRDCDGQGYYQMNLSWVQFAKESLPGYNFTFWEWFYSILRLNRDCLKPLWQSNMQLIHGFLSRTQISQMLADKPVGTFLIRYSESRLGAITIAFKVRNISDNRHFIHHIEPFSHKDLLTRSLPERINDLKILKYLYPGIPKDQAFGQFYEPSREIQPTYEGYIAAELATRIPMNGFDSNQHPAKSPSMIFCLDDGSDFKDDSVMDSLPGDLSEVSIHELFRYPIDFNLFGV